MYHVDRGVKCRVLGCSEQQLQSEQKPYLSMTSLEDGPCLVSKSTNAGTFRSAWISDGAFGKQYGRSACLLNS